MTLRRKMTLQISAVMAGLLLVIAAALWGLNGLRSDFGVASSGYRSLRDVYEIGSHISAAKTFLAAGDRPMAAADVERAVVFAQVFRQHQASEGNGDSRQFADSLDKAVAGAAEAVQRYRDPPRKAMDALDGVLGEVAHFVGGVQQSIQNHEAAANARWRAALWLVALVSIVVVMASVVLGIRQYRGVIRPLVALRAAADRYAAGQLSDRIDVAAVVRGGTEFQQLAYDFNRMAQELEALYRDLEKRVADQSHELVRSERLASVGYLAAGVAHEINNPLGIITGYGERAMQVLEREGQNDPRTLKSLKVMCEEAYRCKAITDRLLSLARPGDSHRSRVRVADLAREVITLVQGLPATGGKAIALHVAENAADATILAVAGEIKQVLLNLILNALDAVCAAGKIVAEVTQDEMAALISVTDDGRGMNEQTLSRIFEPFFTDKRGVRAAGTGLGLSISHAIIANHGGRLRAFSEGPGRGSRFIVELPLAEAVEVGG